MMNYTFIALDNTLGNEFWKSDGTTDGTVLIKDIYPGVKDSSFPTSLTFFNNKLYFTAEDGVNGYELWESDGTTDGTKMVKDLFPGRLSSTPNSLSVFNNILYFCAKDIIHGTELFRYSIETLSSSSTEETLSKVLYFPNPVSNNLEIKTSEPIQKVVLFNFNGQKVKEKLFNTNKVRMSFTNLNNGIYFARIYFNNKQKVIKVIKM